MEKDVLHIGYIYLRPLSLVRLFYPKMVITQKCVKINTQ